MLPTLTLALWALAALAFGLLAVAQARQAGARPARRAFILALAATALWALAEAGIGAGEVVPRLAEAGRTLAWLGFTGALARRVERRGRWSVLAIYGVVACVVLAGGGLVIAEQMLPDPKVTRVLDDGRLILGMMVAVSALVLTHHLRAAAGEDARGGLRVVIAALAAMWAIDLLCFASAWLLGGWPEPLVTVRALATLLLAPVLAVAAHRDGEWTLRVSRAVTFQSLSALALAAWLGITIVATSLIELWGGAQARVWQTAFVFGTATALFTLVANPWLRAWVKVKLAKHLFRHRYDYRAEWARFTDTLGLPGNEAAPLDRRIVKAVADLLCSPAGLLLVPDGPALAPGVGWNWAVDTLPSDERLARHLGETGRIVELDAVRAGEVDAAERAAVPAALLAQVDAWTIVPLLHFGQLVGAIVLARPPIGRALDWEDFDLLRITGRQVASYLAEARALDELAEARRFDEFNRRFAFIMHDIKNLVSGLSLVARNAERHADNPAFRADMAATLKDSADRMNALLARLAQHHGGRAEPLVAVDVLALARTLARRTPHAVVVAGEAALALADPARLEQLLSHLVQNAVEASADGARVTLAVTTAEEGVTIEVADSGSGMTPAFVRDELFRPFHSSKPGGFGIGAFEARALAEAMGGSVEVWSREGEGTRFTVRLARATKLEMAA